MTEIERLQKKLQALFDARNYLLNQQPTDMVAVSEVTERITDISARLSAEVANPTAPPLSAEQITALQAAVNALKIDIQKSEAASAILSAIAVILKA